MNISNIPCLILSILLSFALAPSALGCQKPVSSAALSQEYIDFIKKRAVEFNNSVDEDHNPADYYHEINITSGEHLTMFIRNSLTNPLRWDAASMVLIYFGSFRRAEKEYFVLKADSRMGCLLAPGMGVLLSDGITHHYVTVHAIDLVRGTISLADPWQKFSFLARGRNSKGVAGTFSRGEDGLRLIHLTLSEFERVLIGLQSNIPGPALYEAIEANYSEIDQNQYLEWKIIHLLLTGRHDIIQQTQFYIVEQSINTSDIQALYIFSDLFTRVTVLGMRRKEGEEPDENLNIQDHYLDFLARTIPQSLALIFSRRLHAMGEYERQGYFLSKLPVAYPGEFKIEIARSFLRRERWDDADIALAEAEALFLNELNSHIIVGRSSHEKLDFLWSTQQSPVTLNILRRQYVEIKILIAITLLNRNKTQATNVINGLISSAGLQNIGFYFILFSEDYFTYLIREGGYESLLIELEAYWQLGSEQQKQHVITAFHRALLLSPMETFQKIIRLAAAKDGLKPILQEICDSAKSGSVFVNTPKSGDELLKRTCILR